MRANAASARRDRGSSSSRHVGLVMARTFVAFAVLAGCALFALKADRSAPTGAGAWQASLST